MTICKTISPCYIFTMVAIMAAPRTHVVVAAPARAGAVEGTTENSDAFIWRLFTEFVAPVSQEQPIAGGVRNLGIGQGYLFDQPSLARAWRTTGTACERTPNGEDARSDSIADAPAR